MTGDEVPLPRRMAARVVRPGVWSIRCACDWTTTTIRPSKIAELADRHARLDAFCYVHRNLSPVGEDPIMGDE